MVGGHDEAEDEPDHEAGLLPALPIHHRHPHTHTGDLHRRGHEVTMSGLVPQIDESVKLYNHGEGPY